MDPMLLPVSSYCALYRYSHAVALCFVSDNARCGMFCILCLYNASNHNGVKTGGYGRILAHPVSYPNVFKMDSGSDTDS